MNDTNPSVTEADLHAYADGQLPETTRARIEAFLADNPDEAAMVAAWQAQNGAIRSMFAGYEQAKDTDPLLVVPARRAIRLETLGDRCGRPRRLRARRRQRPLWPGASGKAGVAACRRRNSAETG